MIFSVTQGRLLAVAAVMAGFGAAYSLRPLPKQLHRTEAWLEDATPVTVDGYRAEPGPNGDKQTYRLSAEAYRMLQAYGVINRIFDKGPRNVDVCVIASNTPDSLHDPVVCFPGQGWQILGSEVVATPTKTRGTIPFSVIRAQKPGSPALIAAYCFKGPSSILSTQMEVFKQWKLDDFMSGEAHEGSLYRFIGDDAMSREQLLHFAADYMDAVKATSNGVL